MLQNCRSRRNNRSFRSRRSFRRLEKAKAGGQGRELSYRAIVERHFGKHTGLPHSAKACPKDDANTEAGRRAGGGAKRNQQRHGARREAASIREKAYGSFVRQNRWRHLVRRQTGAVGR